MAACSLTSLPFTPTRVHQDILTDRLASHLFLIQVMHQGSDTGSTSMRTTPLDDGRWTERKGEWGSVWMLVLNHALFRKIRQHSCTALVRFLARSRGCVQRASQRELEQAHLRVTYRSSEEQSDPGEEVTRSHFLVSRLRRSISRSRRARICSNVSLLSTFEVGLWSLSIKMVKESLVLPSPPSFLKPSIKKETLNRQIVALVDEFA